MSRSILVLIYILFFFFYFVGFGLIGNMNSGVSYPWKKVIEPLRLSRYFYTVATVLAAHFLVFKPFFNKKPRWKLVVALLVLLAMYILLRYTIEEVVYPAWLGYGNYSEATSIRYYIVDNVYFGIIIIFVGFVFFLVDELFGTLKQKKRLQERNREAELAFLQSQMNPHFLFNALNSIYSLAYDKHPKTAEAVLKMSDMMRFVTYERGKTIELKKEMEYVNNLLELEQWRRDYKIQVIITNDPQSLVCQVPPLLLVTLVENALKHGELSDEEALAVIETKIIEKKLMIMVRNKIGNPLMQQAGGIGLTNLKRRLELMYDVGEYSFSTNVNGNLFTSQLLIPVS